MKVLIIDDYEGTATTLKRRFEIMGHEAHSISEAKKALDFCCGEELNRFNYILIDLYLNGLNGMDIFGCIKSRGLEDRVVFITGCDGRTEIFKQAAKTGRPIVLKKFNSKEMIGSLEDEKIFQWAENHMRSKGIEINKNFGEEVIPTL